MNVWITGASGMLGRCVGRKLDMSGIGWSGTDLEVDIADRDAVRQIVAERKPTAIINCAAYTAVDAAEADEAIALRANGQGPTVLAEISRAVGAQFIHVSTDYVFDGERSGEHEEDSPVGPSNAYGRTKLAGERGIVRAYTESQPDGDVPPWYVVRTSWLFGAGRSSFVDTMWKLMLEKPELRVVSDQRGRPTYAQDLADFLVSLLGVGAAQRLPSGMWHFANAGPTSWYEFAIEIRSQMLQQGQGVSVKQILPVSTEEFPRPAKRPPNSVLSTRRLEGQGILPRDWRVALAEYIKQRGNAVR